MTSKTHIAKDFLSLFMRDYPLLNTIVNTMAFNSPQRRSTWAADTLLPSSMWPAITMTMLGKSTDDMRALSMKNLSERVSVLASWGLTQGIYRFDKTIYDDLFNTPIIGSIPSKLLMQLPEWCIYIETPGFQVFGGKACKGVWVLLDSDLTDSDHRLLVMFDVRLANGAAMDFAITASVPLSAGTLEEVLALYRKDALAEPLTKPGLDEVMHFLSSHAPNRSQVRHSLTDHSVYEQEVDATLNDLGEALSKVLSLVLYICTQKDVRGANGDTMPKRPTPENTKKGLRVFSPSTPADWDVGVRMGSALRKALESLDSETADEIKAGRQGHSVRPHIRRHHWHPYRVGRAKDDAGNPIEPNKRDLVLHWIPTLPVNAVFDMNIPATIRKVD